MSRFAKKPIVIPQGVEASLTDNTITIKGKLGSLSAVISKSIAVKIEDSKITIGSKHASNTNDNDGANTATKNFSKNPIIGTTISIIQNFIKGTSEGYSKKLELNGVGYRAQIENNKLVLNLGFSHPVALDIPRDIKFETPTQNEIIVSGIDKQLVGQHAAKIRSLRPPEPYKGKGVKYEEEIIVKKEVKKK